MTNAEKREFVSKGCANSFQGVKDTFIQGTHSESELLDIMDEVIKDTLIHYLGIDKEIVPSAMFAIYDEFNHDKKLIGG